MPSLQVKTILDDFRKSPGPILALPSDLSDADLAALTAAVELFAGVEELRVPGSRDANWISGRFLALSASLPKLVRLNLFGSRELTDAGVRAVAQRLTALTALNLWNCSRVTDAGVRAVAQRLTALTTLNLWNCSRVTDAGVSAVAQRLTALTALNLSDCSRVTDAGVSAVALWLTALTTLHLGGCEQVTDAGVRAVAQRLTALTTLNLSGCSRVTNAGVSAVAVRLTALTTLNLGDCNKVTDAGVHVVAVRLTALTTLNLWGCNKVTDAGVRAVAERLTALTALDLSGCRRVTDVGVRAVSERLANLTTLDLRYCGQVTDAGVKAVAQRLTALTTLNLSGCRRVTDVGVRAVAERLTALTALDLSGCEQVTILPDSIGRLRNLEQLDLSNTHLVTLPKVLRDLPRLSRLDVQGIPALKLPEELTRNAGNPRAILDHYFRTTTEEKRALNEAKLILVGNEAVGKTSLVNFLVHNKPCRDTEKTPGVAIEEGVDATHWEQSTEDALVDVKRWKVSKAAAGDTPLKLNVWDFGGQQVLYETHQFFLTARSLYLIVLEARRENANEQEANLYAWLRSISTRTVEAVPVLVVINKSEPPQELRLDEARLMREFPNIRGFVRTSCRDPKKHKQGGRGIAELRKTVVDVIRDALPHVGDQFPLSYFNIKEKMTRVARESFILDLKSYRKKCAAEQVTDEREQENLLTLFDCIGLVVKYNETTLLDPNWLTTAAYRVLTHDAVTAAHGEFSRSELGALLAGLPAEDYPQERWPFIVEMMKRFGLSFELPDRPDRYLLPNQLPEVDPQPPWDDGDALRFRYSYRHTPPRGLLPRFIVQAHQHLTTPRVAWLAGVMLQIQGCEVLVRMNRHERRADVSVSGPKHKRRDALTVVREHFAFVHGLNRFESGQDFTPQVPVNVSGQADAAFDFAFLETCERTGVPRVPYANTSTLFVVKELLEGVGREPVVRDDRDRRGFGGDIHIHGPVGSVSSGQFNDSQWENDVSNINVHNTGNIVGAAIGDGAQVTAEKIISNVRQQLPEKASRADELAAVLKAALEQLGKEQLDPTEREEAEGTVKKIEKELAKPSPNEKLVRGWLGTIEAVSETVGKVLRSAGAIASLFG